MPDTTQDTLDRDEQIVLAYPESVRLIRDDGAREHRRFRFDTPLEPHVHFASDEQKQAELFTTLQAVTGGFRIENVGDRGVPVEIADAGRAALYTYLFAAWSDSVRQIARRFDVDRETVWRSFSRIRSRAPEPVRDERS